MSYIKKHWISLIALTLAVVATYNSRVQSMNLYVESEKNQKVIETQINSLEKRHKEVEESVNKMELKLVMHYMDKLKDKDFIGTYGHGYIWYTAAEGLGNIGKAAIPHLVQRVKTEDDYERALVFYSLLLATQQDNVKEFTGGRYINLGLEFDATKHEEMKMVVYDWWESYKGNFEN